MQRNSRIAGLVLLAGILSGCGGAGSAPLPDANDIVALEKQMWEDWKAQRFPAMGERMSVDAVMTSPDGIADRAGTIAAMTKAACQVDSYSLDDPKVRILSPTVALVAYTARSTQKCAGQAAPESGVGLHSSVWSKQNGTWLTVAHHEGPAK